METDARLWIRDPTGRTWGPLGVPTLRLMIEQGIIAAPYGLSPDGVAFQAGSLDLLHALAAEQGAAEPPVLVPVDEVAGEAALEPVGEPLGTPIAVAPPSLHRLQAAPPEGRLEDVSAMRLYYLIAAAESSGLLILDDGPAQVRIWFRQGRPHAVESRSQDLGLWLVERGVVGREQVSAAAQKSPADPVGALIGAGHLSPAAAFPLIQQHAETVLLHALLLMEGPFAFDAAARPPASGFPLGDRWEILTKTARRLAALTTQVRLASAEPFVPRLVGSVTDLRLTAQELRLVGKLDGSRTLAAILEEAPGLEGDQLRRLVVLLWEIDRLAWEGAPLTEGGEAAAEAEPELAQEPEPESLTDEIAEPVPEEAEPVAPEMEPPPPPPATRATPLPRPARSQSQPPRPATARPTTQPPKPAPAGRATPLPRPAATRPTTQPPKPAPAVARSTTQPPKPAPAPVRPATQPPQPAAARVRPPSQPPRPAVIAPPPPEPAPSIAAPPPRPPPAPTPPLAPAPRPSAVPTTTPEQDGALIAKLREQSFFERLGIAKTEQPPASLKATYFGLIKRYHPDLLPVGAPPGQHKLREEILALLNEAYGTISHPVKLREYLEQMALDEAGLGKMDIEGILRAEDEFRRAVTLINGQRISEGLALLESCIRLNDREGEFYAWRGWASFLLAPDRRAALRPALADVERALELNPRCAVAHLLAGNMAKLSGDASAARRSYQKVLELEPNNVEATRELRLFEQRGT